MQELVSIKGSRQGLSVTLDPSADVDTIIDALKDKLSGSGDFFQGAHAHLDLGTREYTWAELQRIVPVLEQAGFTVTLGGANQPPTKPQTTVSAETFSGETLLAKRTLRSGQKVQFDGNVVLWGDVNPGAEIIASGDIIILGACRGVAHAGAKGDEGAILMAMRLQPTQLRIASYIARPPDNEVNRIGVPEVARIKENTIIIEAYR